MFVESLLPSIDPGIHVRENYSALEEGLKQGNPATLSFLLVFSVLLNCGVLWL